jgi:AcrR family transcriptional regulator
MKEARATAWQRSDDRRAAMLEIARAAFLREGYAAASMSEIAAKVGGSKATLYSYFSSKKDLFAAVIEEEVRQKFAPLFEMDETQGDARTVLERYARRFLDMLLAEDTIAFYRLIVAESARFPEVGQAAYQIGVQQGLDHLAGYFVAAIARGELRQAEASVAVAQFLDLCSGELHRKRLFGVVCVDDRDEVEKQARDAVATFLAAYGADDLSRAARA